MTPTTAECLDQVEAWVDHLFMSDLIVESRRDYFYEALDEFRAELEPSQ